MPTPMLPAGTRYRLNQQVVSIGNDYWVEDEDGQRVLVVDGKVMRLTTTLILEDLQGETKAVIRRRLLRPRETFAIVRDHRTVATVRRPFLSFLRDRLVVRLQDGGMTVRGDLLEHEYRIEQGGELVGEISKRWFSLHDSYGVEVEEGQDALLVIAIAVCVHVMSHQQDRTD